MRGRLRWISWVSIGAAALLGLCAAGGPMETLWAEIYKTAWAGIYAEDQAVRGEAIYRVRCAACHGASLQGTDFAPSLAGRDFAYDWDCGNIADLFEKIQFTMPANRPGRLSDGQVADVLAYVLKANGLPAGRRALSTNVDDLRGVRFMAADPGR